MSPTMPTRSVPPVLTWLALEATGVGVMEVIVGTAATAGCVGAAFAVGAAAPPAAAVGWAAGGVVGAEIWAGVAAPLHAASSAADAVLRTRRSAARRLGDAGTPSAGRLLLISGALFLGFGCDGDSAVGRDFAVGSVRPVGAVCAVEVGLLLEGFALRAQVLPEVLVLRHHRPTGALAVHLGLVDSWRNRAVLTQLFGGCQQPTSDANDHRVGRAQRLFAAVDNRALAPGDRAVLDDHARHARV